MPMPAASPPRIQLLARAARAAGATGIAGAAKAPEMSTARRHGSPSAAPRALQALGGLGLLGVVTSVFFVAAGAAAAPSRYVPESRGGWPAWLAGPLQHLGLGIGSASFQALTLIMCASYLAVLLSARALPLRALAGAIVAAHLILLLGPPLISGDVFG